MSGELIHELSAVWETPYSSALWKEFEEIKSIRAVPRGAGDAVPLGLALPDAEDGRLANVHVGFRTAEEQDEPQGVLWILRLREPPDLEPPDTVKADDATIGGRPGLMRLVQRHLPKLPPVVSLRMTMAVPNEYRCMVLPIKPVGRDGEHRIAASLAETTRLEQVGYRFEDSPYGLEEVAIVYAHRNDLFMVTVRARRLMQLGSTRWLPPADEVCDIVLEAFFERRARS